MGTVSSVLNHLSDLILHEAQLLGGLRQEIQHIVDELEHMKAFLIFAEGRDEEEDLRLQVWISQVRDVAYDIQDVADEFLLRFSHNHGHAQKILNSVKNLRSRHQLAQEIQCINSRITKISESHKRYQSEYNASNDQVSASSVASNNSWHSYRDEALLVEEAKLVGIDQPKQHLIDGDNSQQLKVVSVLGMGGIGKTTLVKKVQEDADVKRQFQIFAWVTVSQTFDMKELLKDLIQQLYKEIQKPIPQEVDSAKCSTDQLKVLIKEFLLGKKYLIVFERCLGCAVLERN